jgi:hypothetical protein
VFFVSEKYQAKAAVHKAPQSLCLIRLPMWFLSFLLDYLKRCKSRKKLLPASLPAWLGGMRNTINYLDSK